MPTPPALAATRPEPAPRVPGGRAASTRARIVAAAEELVLRDGVAHLTIEATAAGAGLSKGGVLYHFPTRSSLVAAMVTKIVDAFDADIAAGLSADPDGPGAYTRAYVRASVTADPGISTPGGEGGDREDRLGAAVIAAAAAEPALLAPLQDAADRWQAHLAADGLQPAVATAVRMACDGLWLCDLFGLAAPTGSERAALADALLALAEGAS